MLGIKQAILAIAGISALGGASVGCYYCFKPKAPESSQTIDSSSSPSEVKDTRITDNTNRSSNVGVGRGSDSSQTTLPSQPATKDRSLSSGSLPAGSSESAPQGHTG